jgi:hypothetical protein
VKPAHFLLVAALGCAGQVDDGISEPGRAEPAPARPGSGPARDGTSPAPPGTPGAPGPDAPGATTKPLRPGPGGLRRLTAPQFAATLRDLLGPVTLPEIEPDTAHSGFAAVGASTISVSPIGVEKYEAAARAAVEQVFSDPKRRDAFFGCAPGGAPDEACARAFVKGFGRRAWRRPLTGGELDRYTAAAVSIGRSLGDGYGGLRHVATALLQSPHFLYRVEVGRAAQPGTTLRRYDPHEMATRLSYLLWNSTPDDALLAEADAGGLTDAASVRAAAARLLASPRAREGLGAFLAELFAIEHVETVAKDAAVFSALTPALRRSMQTEFRRLFEAHALERRADLLELFTTRDTVVDGPLARFYGLEGPSGAAFAAATHPANGARAGLLGTGAFLVLWGKQHETSPTLRGKFIRTALLCGEVPSPPPGVSTVLPDLPPGARISRRMQLAQHVSDPSCAGCHGLVDPLGLGLEQFDAIGRFRTTERGAAIDPSGALEGAPFADARGLGERLRANPGVRDCLLRNFYRFATGRIETADEAPALAALGAAFDAQGRRLPDLVVALVTSDAFRLAAPPVR